ncbi:sulfatase family protein [Paeniglutamicibacter sp. R2-26]|uniref:sulfatase family protein n=1 Tax=Paeniglutamicibacter sp. R2-26 TaxID=3144417 RepID=UPI003EE46D46
MSEEARGAAGRPNIVFIIADQLRADHLGFNGNTEVRTPNLDRLASDAAVFDRTFVANPTCMPNRASLLTGRWPSVHGTRCNGIPLDPDASTFVRSLAQAGYRTAAVGKLHHQSMGWDFEPEQDTQIRATDPGLLDAGTERAVGRAREAGWDQWENRVRHDGGFVEMPRDYYGYQEVDLVIGHGDAPGGHWVHWARERGVDPRVLGGPEAAAKPPTGWDQVYTTSIPLDVHPSTYVGERAARRITEGADSADPYFLFVSFPDPHHPFAPPEDYAGLYDPESVELPRGFDQGHGDSPEHIRRMVAERGTPNSDATMTFAVSEDQYRRAAAAQYGLIELMDAQVGRILQAVQDSGRAQDTIVVFTSDHGDMFGDHGLMLKHFVHYESVTRVPLVIRIPGAAGGEQRRSNALASTADLAPTLLGLAGVRGFHGIQGRSLQPLLEGSVESVRDAVLIEEDQPFSIEGLPAPVRMRSVVTAQGRLTRYFGAPGVEVYDHRTDAAELHNVAGKPEAAQLQRELEIALLEEMARVCDTAPTPSNAA